MRIKKLISIVLSAIMVLSVTVAMSACSPREKRFYYLFDEYNNGNVAYKEAKQIAIYFAMQTNSPIQEKVEPYYEYGNKKEWRTIEYDKNGKLPQLSKKKMTEIKDAIYKNWEYYFVSAAEQDNNEGASKEEQLEKYLDFEYCGTYHGKYALAIKIKGWIFNCSVYNDIISGKIQSCLIEREFFLYY